MASPAAPPPEIPSARVPFALLGIDDDQAATLIDAARSHNLVIVDFLDCPLNTQQAQIIRGLFPPTHIPAFTAAIADAKLLAKNAILLVLHPAQHQPPEIPGRSQQIQLKLPKHPEQQFEKDLASIVNLLIASRDKQQTSANT